MKKNIAELSETIQFIQSILNVLTRLRKQYDCTLKTWHGPKRNRYYVRENGEYRYLKKTEIGLAREIAQQEFDDALAGELLKMIACGREFEQLLANPPWLQLFERLSPAKQALVQLPVQSDKELIEEWLSRSGDSLSFESEKRICPSLRGEMFRSKSEASIADLFDAHGITYVYERALFLEATDKTVYPDFKLFMPHTGREIIWEHFGMVDSPEYADNMVKKINMYIINGYRPGVDFFFTFESYAMPLNKSVVICLINQILSAND